LEILDAIPAESLICIDGQFHNKVAPVPMQSDVIALQENLSSDSTLAGENIQFPID
jgi:hypothetical protein